MTQQIPDAPWIREAEMYGMPDVEDCCCPVCGAEDPEKFYYARETDEVLGCSECIGESDPYEFLADHREEGGLN